MLTITQAPAALYARYDGSSNFAIVAHKGGERVGLLVNVIGAYDGVTLLEAGDQLEVTGQGAWHIELRPLLGVPLLKDTPSGHGDQVVFYPGPAGKLTATHSGKSNFAVTIYASKGRHLLVNDIGAYSGTVVLPAGPGFLVIEADGDWTIVLG